MASPGRARSRSPLSPPQSSAIEGFNWPDVRELCSKYLEHGRSQKSPVSRSRSIPEQMFDGGLRRHSSCSSSLLLPDGASEEVPSFKLQDTSREERRKRLHRANSLDPRLSGEQLTELQKLQDQAANGNYSGYYVAAEAPLPNDPEHKIVVVEKLPEAESEPAETTKEEEDKDDNYVQIRSPTSREKISIMAVIDRCRVYQESDEYKLREEVKAKAEADTATNERDNESQKTSSDCGQKTDGGQQNIVKNLRDKFQNLS